MLVLHFSHVCSLAGVARALEAGREDWGLSELGRKAGAPPGWWGQTHESTSQAAAPGLYSLFTLTSPNTASRRLIKGALTTDPKVALGAMGGGSVHASFWAEAGQVQGAPGRPS